MKKFFKLFCLLTLTSMVYANAFAQDQKKGAAIVFTSTVHDFGQIVESDGPVTCSFEFINIGDQPLVINSVNPSCGCTTPGWTKEPIAPGAKGSVEATYNPKGRVAPFDKTLTVNATGTPAMVTLRIKGVVLPTPVDLKTVYPIAVGNFRFKKAAADFGVVASDSPKMLVIETANADEAPATIAFGKLPDYIKVQTEPATLQPKQQGVIQIIYDPSKKKDFGFSKDQINVTSGNQKSTIDITAIVQENLPVVTPLNNAQDNTAPRAVVKTSSVDLGTITKGKPATIDYDITNEGKTDLIIRNVTSSSNEIKSSVKNIKIKPGKTGTVKFNYTPTEQGVNTVKAYIATNAPSSTLIGLDIKATVN